MQRASQELPVALQAGFATSADELPRRLRRVVRTNVYVFNVRSSHERRTPMSPNPRAMYILFSERTHLDIGSAHPTYADTALPETAFVTNT